MDIAMKMLLVVLLGLFSIDALAHQEPDETVESGSQVGKPQSLTCEDTSEEMQGFYYIDPVDDLLRGHIDEKTNLSIWKKGELDTLSIFYVDGTALGQTGSKMDWIGHCKDGKYTIVGKFDVITEGESCSHGIAIQLNPRGPARKPDGSEWRKQIRIQSQSEHNTRSCKNHLAGHPIPDEQPTTNDSDKKTLHPGAAHGGTD